MVLQNFNRKIIVKFLKENYVLMKNIAKQPFADFSSRDISEEMSFKFKQVQNCEEGKCMPNVLKLCFFFYRKLLQPAICSFFLPYIHLYIFKNKK